MWQYNVGGQFLKILQNLYSENQMFVKLDEGLTKPFVRTVGLIESLAWQLLEGLKPDIIKWLILFLSYLMWL